MYKRHLGSIVSCHVVCAIFDSLGGAYPLALDQLEGVIRALEDKFPYNRAHSDRVVGVARVIADELAIPVEKVVTICRAACLHDVGKIGIPGEILTKPGKLTEKERRVVKKHPGVAARLLQKLLYPKECIDLVYHHHEWFNGKGYPCRCEGSNIPLGARVIAVADAFDAMTSDRPYRRAMSQEDAEKELRDYAGSQFDPEVVEALSRACKKGILASRQD